MFRRAVFGRNRYWPVRCYSSNGYAAHRFSHRGQRGPSKEKQVAKGEFIYGSDAVLAALKARNRTNFHRLYVQASVADDNITQAMADARAARTDAETLARDLDVEVEHCDRNKVDRLCGQRLSNGIVLDVDPLSPEVIHNLNQALEPTESPFPPVWVALDQVVDPQNLGAILRSSHFFGVGGVVICRKNSSPLSPTVAKTSCGALEHINIKFCRSMPTFLTNCKSDWDIIGMSVGPGSVSWRDLPKPTRPTLLVLGSEGSGLRKLVENQCSHLAKLEPRAAIQPTEGLDSLNVSTALGVALFQLLG